MQAQQERRQTGVQQVQLWAFADALAEVFIIRPQQVDELTGFQHGQPALYRRGADTDFIGQVRHIQQVAGARGNQHEEPGEGAQVADLG